MKFGHSNMQVFVWSSQDGAFNPAKAEAFCVINSDSINECNLIIFETVSFMATKIFKVVYGQSTDLALAENNQNKVSHVIESDSAALSIDGMNNPAVTMTHLNKLTNKKNMF